MRFLQDMFDKHGFDDGSAMPEGVEMYRAVYVKAINAAAERHGSKFRVREHDRLGCHNWCEIEHIDLNGVSVSGKDVDDAFREAMCDIEESVADPDDFVIMAVTIQEAEFEAFLKRLKGVSHECRGTCGGKRRSSGVIEWV